MSNEIVYPADFVAHVKEEFPENERLHELLDSNAYDVGPRLKDLQQGSFCAEDTISLLDDGKIGELKELAEGAVHRRALYMEWFNIMCVGFGLPTQSSDRTIY